MIITVSASLLGVAVLLALLWVRHRAGHTAPFRWPFRLRFRKRKSEQDAPTSPVNDGKTAVLGNPPDDGA